MRLWSMHPDYLDPLGLSRCYFEGLGGLKCLLGLRRMHKNHPQLIRFKSQKDPIISLSLYLNYVLNTAKNRNKIWDEELLIKNANLNIKMPVTKGQIDFEINWLLTKIKNRKKVHKEFIDKLMSDKKDILLHPIFYKVDGEIEFWEKTKI